MARPKAFDQTETLEKAMMLFWRHGYEGTSIQDLVEHTGLNRGSLYATYGDKRRLFLAALDHYRNVIAARRLRLLGEGESGKAAIRGFFEEAVDHALGEGRQLGCLLTNSAVELAPHDPELAAPCLAGIARTEQAFLAALERARTAGEIAPERDLPALARFLTSSLQGLRVTARAMPDRQRLEDIVQATLSVLD